MSPKEQLNLLAIFHYVVGGLHALFGSLGLFYVAFGLFIVLGGFANMPHSNTESLPPAFIGFFPVAFGAVFVLIGWSLALLTIISGRKIAQRKSRKFSIAVGAINCAIFPFGTALGVFTLIQLVSAQGEREYSEIPAA